MHLQNTELSILLYQNLTNIIRINWEITKMQMKLGEVVYPGKRTYNPAQPFETHNLPQKIEDAKNARGYFRLHDHLQYLIRSPLDYTARQTIGPDLTDLSDFYRPIVNSPYFQTLHRNTDQLVRLVSAKYAKVDHPTYGIVNAGIGTAGEMLIQLGLVLESQASHRTALVASKIRESEIATLAKNTGQESVTVPVTERSYQAFDFDNPHGLNVEFLKSLGFGAAIGCPAGLKVDAEAKKFIQDMHLIYGLLPECAEVSGTMLSEAAIGAFGLTSKVHKWYNDLPQEDKEVIVGQDRFLLEGGARTSLEGRRRRKEG